MISVRPSVHLSDAYLAIGLFNGVSLLFTVERMVDLHSVTLSEFHPGSSAVSVLV